MFKKSKTKDVEEIMVLTKKILKIVYIFIIFLSLYLILGIVKELHLFNFVLTVLKILSPLFIGIFIAWLFDPFVKYLQQKGIKRSYGAIIVYIIFIGLIVILISAIIPILNDQINDFAKTIPSILETFNGWINNLFDKISINSDLDVQIIKNEIFAFLETIGNELPTNLPKLTIDFIKAFFSGIGVFLVSLVIGFYLLNSFENVNELIITMFPIKYQNDAREFTNELNLSMRKFVQGMLLGATIIFLISAIGFSLAGLKGALLFSLFCGITNIIPFIGPYIGGIPAVIVAFSQSTQIGIFVLLIIVIVQFIEGNFIQPLLMSKMMKLHPVTVILGLLIFGYFWGIIGMILSTPIIATTKLVFSFFKEKFAQL